MIRDYWKVKPGRLVDEIEAIKDQVHPRTWEAIDAVRTIGNIGAHMEKDINLIVEVDSGEAKLLIELIETLVDDWYVVSHDREARNKQLVSAAESKKTPPVELSTQTSAGASLSYKVVRSVGDFQHQDRGCAGPDSREPKHQLRR